MKTDHQLISEHPPFPGHKGKEILMCPEVPTAFPPKLREDRHHPSPGDQLVHSSVLPSKQQETSDLETRSKGSRVSILSKKCKA